MRSTLPGGSIETSWVAGEAAGPRRWGGAHGVDRSAPQCARGESLTNHRCFKSIDSAVATLAVTTAGVQCNVVGALALSATRTGHLQDARTLQTREEGMGDWVQSWGKQQNLAGRLSCTRGTVCVVGRSIRKCLAAALMLI